MCAAVVCFCLASSWPLLAGTRVRLGPWAHAWSLYLGHMLYQLNYWGALGSDLLIRRERFSVTDFICLNKQHKHTVFIFMTE